jgi:hypothetical protein
MYEKVCSFVFAFDRNGSLAFHRGFFGGGKTFGQRECPDPGSERFSR